MTKPRVSARDQIRVVASVLNIPEPFVRQVVTRMKTDRRLPATRPLATDMTPQSLARLLLGLCASLPHRSSELERLMGMLPRDGGDGADTVSLELERIAAAAASEGTAGIDFHQGDILIGTSSAVVMLTIEKFDGTSVIRTYRASREDDDGLAHFVRIPLRTVRLLALELLDY